MISRIPGENDTRDKQLDIFVAALLDDKGAEKQHQNE